jgi:hypothetical protein
MKKGAKQIVAVSAVCVLSGVNFANADIGYFEGFEDAGWVAGQTGNWQNYAGGDIQRAASGTDGITSSDGTAHAIITNLSVQEDVFGNPSLGAASPYTTFGGYSSIFGGGFTASLDVYLDTTWTTGDGFDYTVAMSRQDGTHLRDYMFHVGVTDQGLLVNASNNSDYNYNEYKLENENSAGFYTVAASGWYTLQQDFYDDGGNVSVDMILLDSAGTELWNVTRTSSDDVATTAGGNRYGWFTYNNIEGLAVDNTSMIPEPASAGLIVLMSGGIYFVRRFFNV